MPLNSEERFAALLEALAGTEKQLESGEAIYRDLKKTVRRMRVTVWVAVIGLCLDLLLSVVLGLGLVNQVELGNKVNGNANNLHDVECSTNSLFIGVDTPDAYAKAPDKAKYVAQFHVIYQQRIQLGCQPMIPEPTNR